MLVMKLHADKLKELIFEFRYEFWPSSLINPEVDESLRKRSRLAFMGMSTLYSAGTVYVLGYMIHSLARGNMELPLLSDYGFDVTVSPVYEIVYILQVINQLFSVIYATLGHDSLLFAMCSNAIGQFILLKNRFANILKESDREMVLRQCIRHHYMLFRYI